MTKLAEIEGIGPVYEGKLAKAGVATVEALLDVGCTPAGRKKLAEATGISGKRILRWVNHADLYRIKGVARQYAELLEKAGVDTVVELSGRKAENLVQKMIQVNKQYNLVNNVPELGQVAAWIAEANTLPRKVTY